jgi:hypothetical protein
METGLEQCGKKDPTCVLPDEDRAGAGQAVRVVRCSLSLRRAQSKDLPLGAEVTLGTACSKGQLYPGIRTGLLRAGSRQVRRSQKTFQH